MTKQEIFDTVYLGMKSQGFRQSVKGFDCRYRNKRKKLKCTAGWLIPDQEYNARKMEGLTIHELSFFANHEHLDFIDELQYLHDESMMIEEMRWRLQKLGCEHGLRIPDDNIYYNDCQGLGGVES
jgi:hypothetical protein